MAYPIIISVYTRFENLKNCIASLRANPEAQETDLYVVSDAPREEKDASVIKQIRNQIYREANGFAGFTLLAWDKNKGMHLSINDAIAFVLKTHSGCIFLEDDNVVSPYFLRFMNYNLQEYKYNNNVFSICGWNHLKYKVADYPYETYFYPAVAGYGLGLWKGKWEKYRDNFLLPKRGDKTFERFRHHNVWAYDFLIRDSRIGDIADDSRMCYYIFENNLVSLFPVRNIVKNVGIGDGIGEHCGDNLTVMDQELYIGSDIFNNPPTQEVFPEIDQFVKAYFSYTLFQKIYYFFYRRGIILPNSLRLTVMSVLAKIRRRTLHA
jgi:hypothetical protein